MRASLGTGDLPRACETHCVATLSPALWLRPKLPMWLKQAELMTRQTFESGKVLKLDLETRGFSREDGFSLCWVSSPFAARACVPERRRTHVCCLEGCGLFVPCWPLVENVVDVASYLLYLRFSVFFPLLKGPLRIFFREVLREIIIPPGQILVSKRNVSGQMRWGDALPSSWIPRPAIFGNGDRFFAKYSCWVKQG